ncbi:MULTISPECIES: hypothetical protein [Streptomyces]|uniref:Uncharacterized protein n=1 Tax=Streptomyces cremeus TaxID=66881 RepID=A0ABV5PIY3_STRCM
MKKEQREQSAVRVSGYRERAQRRRTVQSAGGPERRLDAHGGG